VWEVVVRTMIRTGCRQSEVVVVVVVAMLKRSTTQSVWMSVALTAVEARVAEE
jgi:hypothetical protein